MIEQNYPSQLLDDAVGELSKLPGVGRKTALRLALFLLRQSTDSVDAFAGAISKMRHEVRYCRVCHNISDTDICPICANPKRDTRTICVVENIRDVMAVENTQQYGGLYHVLGGVISPMDGVGPSDPAVWQAARWRRSSWRSVRRWRATPPISSYRVNSHLMM